MTVADIWAQVEQAKRERERERRELERKTKRRFDRRQERRLRGKGEIGLANYGPGQRGHYKVQQGVRGSEGAMRERERERGRARGPRAAREVNGGGLRARCRRLGVSGRGWDRQASCSTLQSLYSISGLAQESSSRRQYGTNEH